MIKLRFLYFIGAFVTLTVPSAIWAQQSFIVNSLADTHDDSLKDGICRDKFGNCTLRAAIEQARAKPVQIGFEVAGTINLILGSPPTIPNGSTISGFNQQLIINGSGSTVFNIGSNTVVQGLIITGASATFMTGIRISGSNNTIGGLTSATRNVIVGNQYGIMIFGSQNIVVGNFIGTDVTGTAAQANGTGIEIVGSNNLIGGTTSEARNIISGNTYYGIWIPRGTGNKVQGNFIGTDVTGKAAIGNGYPGIQIYSSNNVIGGTVAGAGNVISGNKSSGVSIGLNGPTATGNVVQGNFIGTDLTGTIPIGNDGDGVSISGYGHTIGGKIAGASNVISWNKLNGISIHGDSCLVQGNFIGITGTGNNVLSNGKSGIQISGSNNIIGGRVEGSRNVISGNKMEGISVISGVGNRIQGNYIGTDVSGSIALGNGTNGVGIPFPSGNTVGGIEEGTSNIIAYNSSISTKEPHVLVHIREGSCLAM